MTELTPRQILDAIRRGLEETARRFTEPGARRPGAPRQAPERTEPATAAGGEEERKGLADRLVAIGKDCAARLKEPLRSADHADLLYDERGLPRES
jgi:hypothetical protein